MKKLTTLDKALEINLDPSQYGSFAEIGAGQEVANWFFKASASAGTVAKSISAYDMTMSDSIYGEASRYVSRERMLAMVDKEYQDLQNNLGEKFGAEKTFFAYCNTVRARGYNDDAECFGWMGMRFQTSPLAPPTDILIHVRLLDRENVDQMDALGILGVNLVYGAFYYRDDLKQFVESLIDGIDTSRVEIDMLKFGGYMYEDFDNRLSALQLVKSRLALTAMFDSEGEVVQAAEELYGRPIALLRGSFKPVTNVHMDLLEQTKAQFLEMLPEEQKEKLLEICEISMANMLRGEEVDSMDPEDFLNRVNALKALKKTVVISRCAEFYRLIEVLNRYTKKPTAIILSIGLLHEMFKEKWSENLDGGVLESFGRLFKHGNQLYVSSWLNQSKNKLVTADLYNSPPEYKYLYQHFLENKMVNTIQYENHEALRYNSRDILKMISDGDDAWKALVPDEVHQYLLH